MCFFDKSYYFHIYKKEFSHLCYPYKGIKTTPSSFKAAQVPLRRSKKHPATENVSCMLCHSAKHVQAVISLMQHDRSAFPRGYDSA